jgi:hypothetical protein
VALSSISLFAIVFALLSYRLMAGLDPSTSSVATATSPGTSSATSSSAYTSEDQNESDDGDDVEGDDDWSAPSSDSEDFSTAPTTGAS